MRNIHVTDNGFRARTAHHPGHQARTGYGVALDVGTTNVSMSVFSWDNGERLAVRGFRNPQGAYGSDVIARLMKASSEAVAVDLQCKLFTKVNELLHETVAAMGIDLADVTSIGIVGNTAMLALLYNCAHQQLLDPQYWQASFAFSDTEERTVAELLDLSGKVGVQIIDPLAGFVGSDLLAGVVAIRVLEQKRGTLFVDFGTNTEIALWDGSVLWVTAASGGPAFEGCGTSCGIAALPGAILRVSRSDQPGTLFEVSTIDGRDPRGICGSGYVDIISGLLELNLLDSVGRFAGKMGDEQEITIIEKAGIKVTKKDIDTLQRAKAAVAAGIRGLLLRAGMSTAHIEQIYVAGNFGRFLDIPHAQRIGLLPDIKPDKVHICDNAALRGCEDMMQDQAAGEMLAEVRKKAKYVNLAFDAEFESLFMDSLYLKPF